MDLTSGIPATLVLGLSLSGSLLFLHCSLSVMHFATLCLTLVMEPTEGPLGRVGCVRQHPGPGQSLGRMQDRGAEAVGHAHGGRGKPEEGQQL